MTVKAYYRLSDVFNIIDSGRPNSIWFSARSKSIDAVIKVYMATDTPKTIKEAQKFVLAGIKTLANDDFIQQLYQWGCVTDVYGLIYDKRPWYVKFRIDENNDLEEISFHPPEREMKTVGGKWIPKGEFL